MASQAHAIIALMKKKRKAESLSIRALSEKISVSFSTLARIERGDGEPDHNTQARILNWLGDFAKQAGIQFHQATQVHFRAAKNADTSTIKCLLEVAELVKEQFGEAHGT